eukprot:Em0001g2419a
MLKELSQSLYVSKTHSTHDRLMLQAALAVAFFGFLRVSKFTVNSWKRKAMRRGRFLAKQDVLLAPYDLQLTIKYSKMDQLGKGSIITMGLTRSSLLSSPRHAILLKVLSCQASCSIITLPVWQAAVSPKAYGSPSILSCARTAMTQGTITHTASEKEQLQLQQELACLLQL